MRIAEFGYNNNYRLTYPERFIFTQDNNYIRIESVDNHTPIGSEITIVNQATAEQKTLKHNSELYYIVFDLNDTIRNLYDGQQMTYSVHVQALNWGIPDGEFSFTINILDGKSFTDRSHGAEETIYVYDDEDLTKLQLWSNLTGLAAINGLNIPIYYGYNALNLEGHINEGVNTMCFIPQSDIHQIEITAFTQVKNTSARLNFAFNSTTASGTNETKGDIWPDTKYSTTGYCIDIIKIESCSDFNGMKFRYKNTDGCIRYAYGKIHSTETTSKAENYTVFDASVFKNIPHRIITSDSRTATVAFDQMKRNAFFADILLCQNVEFQNYEGEWYTCTIEDNSIKNSSDEAEDYELKFCLNKSN